MEIEGKTIVVTGGASGIGKALCEAFHQAGARKVVVADIDLQAAQAVAARIDGVAVGCDVSSERQIRHLIVETEAYQGPIDLFCSNAGIASGFDNSFENAADAPDYDWQKAWAINVMAHVYAARILIPLMKVRGGGYLLNTVSAAGLLSQIGSAVYSTTKQAAVGFAENIAITHMDDGISVSILCPQGVDTPMLRGLPEGPQSGDGVMTAEEVAACALEGVRAEQFLILPHKEVETYVRRKGEDRGRWIGSMVRLKRKIAEAQAT